MTLKVMTSAEKVGGPENFKKKICFIILNENKQTWFLLKMQKSKKSTYPILYKNVSIGQTTQW
jgi:hypothetical protein